MKSDNGRNEILEILDLGAISQGRDCLDEPAYLCTFFFFYKFISQFTKLAKGAGVMFKRK